MSWLKSRVVLWLVPAINRAVPMDGLSHIGWNLPFYQYASANDSARHPRRKQTGKTRKGT